MVLVVVSLVAAIAGDVEVFASAGAAGYGTFMSDGPTPPSGPMGGIGAAWTLRPADNHFVLMGKLELLHLFSEPAANAVDLALLTGVGFAHVRAVIGPTAHIVRLSEHHYTGEGGPTYASSSTTAIPGATFDLSVIFKPVVVAIVSELCLSGVLFYRGGVRLGVIF